ncbi:MAG: CO/xanthine dehydrogenase FAD-binding subunit [Desulforhopalus sp.]|jgi:CO/xanthine dehydrogenase FAD-binding subunit
MLEIENIIFPSSLDEALATVRDVPSSVVLGGCGYLRLGSRKIGTAVDLSRLGLGDVAETVSEIEIGAMVSLRALETHEITTGFACGVLARSVENIVGIQLRQCVTLGGSVAGRYPFSDPIAALLALDAELLFHGQGRISLQEYLNGKGLRDILVKIIIPKRKWNAAFTSVRKSATDYAVLNCAVARCGDEYLVVVGSRPSRAIRVAGAESFLLENGLTCETAMQAGLLAATEVQFGDNPRGSGEYRRKICPVLVKRALLEVLDAA